MIDDGVNKREKRILNRSYRTRTGICSQSVFKFPLLVRGRGKSHDRHPLVLINYSP